jgi:hypothetical protein
LLVIGVANRERSIPGEAHGLCGGIDTGIEAGGVGLLCVDLVLRRAGGKACHDTQAGDRIQRHIDTGHQATGQMIELAAHPVAIILAIGPKAFDPEAVGVEVRGAIQIQIGEGGKAGLFGSGKAAGKAQRRI